MENQALIFSYILVIGAVSLSWMNQLKLEREIVLSSLRATLQLIAVGFLLTAIFKIQQREFHFLILLAMCLVAAGISGGRGKAIPHSYAIAFVGILIGSLIPFMVLYAVGIIQPEARFMIPLGGMVIGNSMKASSVALNRLTAEFQHQKRQIETLLSLGASARQAAKGVIQPAIKAGLIPTLDTMKSVGLVHLPGIMTGYLIAGGDPLTAVKFQLAIIYMLAGTSGITCLVVALLAYKNCFNEQLQLLPLAN